MLFCCTFLVRAYRGIQFRDTSVSPISKNQKTRRPLREFLCALCGYSFLQICSARIAEFTEIIHRLPDRLRPHRQITLRVTCGPAAFAAAVLVEPFLIFVAGKNIFEALPENIADGIAFAQMYVAVLHDRRARGQVFRLHKRAPVEIRILNIRRDAFDESVEIHDIRIAFEEGDQFIEPFAGPNDHIVVVPRGEGQRMIQSDRGFPSEAFDVRDDVGDLLHILVADHRIGVENGPLLRFFLDAPAHIRYHPHPFRDGLVVIFAPAQIVADLAEAVERRLNMHPVLQAYFSGRLDLFRFIIKTGHQRRCVLEGAIGLEHHFGEFLHHGRLSPGDKTDISAIVAQMGHDAAEFLQRHRVRVFKRDHALQATLRADVSDAHFRAGVERPSVREVIEYFEQSSAFFCLTAESAEKIY